MLGLGKRFGGGSPKDGARDDARRIVVEGVGPDAPTVTHENGSKESLCLYALDVIPWTLWCMFASDPVIASIARFLHKEVPEVEYLRQGLEDVLEEIARVSNAGSENLPWAMLKVGAVLAEGERKRGDDRNWRGIPVRQHLRHALTHRFAHLAGDRSEGDIGHLTHCGARLGFAIDVLCSQGT